MGRNPHRKPSSSPHKGERKTVAGDTTKHDAELGNSLRNLSTAADTARHDLLASGELNPIGKSIGNRRERMDEVRRKIAEGYYDRQEIRHKVAERLADDMNP